jgi:Electron transfer DM13
VVGRARLQGIDHRASGEVLLASGTDGSYVVRLERLDVEPSPDYQVYLVPGSAADPSGGVRLDHLLGNRGSQNYPVPATAGTTVRPVTVLIWCRAFAVPVAAATIR